MELLDINYNNLSLNPSCIILIKGSSKSSLNTLFELLFQINYNILIKEKKEEYSSYSSSITTTTTTTLIGTILNNQKYKNNYKDIKNERDDSSLNNHTSLSFSFSSSSSSFSSSSHINNEKKDINEVFFSFDKFSDIFSNSFNENVTYKFVDCGQLSPDLCKKYTKYAGGMILVIDKENLQMNILQSQILMKTLEDINLAKTTGYNLPLIIVINKIDIDDPEDIQLVETFQTSFHEYTQRKEPSLKYQYAVMSAYDAYLYRQFSLNQSFVDMEPRDILRLCGNELGSEGKSSARDLTHHHMLIEKLKQNILTPEGKARWTRQTGLNSFIDSMNSLIFQQDNIYHLLMSQITLHLNDMGNTITPTLSVPPSRLSTPSRYSSPYSTLSTNINTNTSTTSTISTSTSSTLFSSSYIPNFSNTYSSPSTQSKSFNGISSISGNNTTINTPINSNDNNRLKIDQHKNLLESIILTHKHFISLLPLNFDNSSMLIENGENQLYEVESKYKKYIQQVCREKYEQILTKLIQIFLKLNFSGYTSILSILNKHEILDNYELMSSELWERIKLRSILMGLENLWYEEVDTTFSLIKPLDTSFQRPCKLFPDSSRVGSIISDSIETINSIISSTTSSEFITKLIKYIVIPLITMIPVTISYLLIDIKNILHLSRNSNSDNNQETINLVSPENSPHTTPTNESSEDYLYWKENQYKNNVILTLEKYVLSLLQNLNDPLIQIDLLESIIKKKISIREYLPGYTVCLREYLDQSRDLRNQKFSLFFPILYSSLKNDITWGETLPQELNYEKDILKNPLIRSESLLHQVLSGEYPIGSTLSRQFNNNDNNNFQIDNSKFRSIKSEPILTSFNIKIKQEGYHSENINEAVKRKRISPPPPPSLNSSSSSSSPIEEVENVAEPPEIVSLIPTQSPPRETPKKFTPSRRRIMIGQGEC